MHIGTAAQVLVAAGTDEQRYMSPPGEGEWRLMRLVFTPATSVSKHATNYHTVAVKTGPSGSTIATWNTTVASGIAYTAGTAIVPTLTQLYTTFTGGTDAIEIGVTSAGAGAAFDGEFAAQWEKVHGD